MLKKCHAPSPRNFISSPFSRAYNAKFFNFSICRLYTSASLIFQGPVFRLFQYYLLQKCPPKKGGVGADREGGGKVLDRGAGVLLKKLMSGKAVSKTRDLSC